MRFFLGTGKYTPTAAVSGEMGWHPAFVKQWKSVCIYWNRMIHMDAGRTIGAFLYGLTESLELVAKKHIFSMKEKFRKLGLNQYSDKTASFSRNKCIYDIFDRLMTEYIEEWHVSINRESGRSGVGRNKLRTYRIFK